MILVCCVFDVRDEIKRVALRPLRSHYKEGLTATGKGLGNEKRGATKNVGKSEKEF